MHDWHSIRILSSFKLRILTITFENIRCRFGFGCVGVSTSAALVFWLRLACWFGFKNTCLISYAYSNALQYPKLSCPSLCLLPLLCMYTIVCTNSSTMTHKIIGDPLTPYSCSHLFYRFPMSMVGGGAGPVTKTPKIVTCIRSSIRSSNLHTVLKLSMWYVCIFFNTYTYTYSFPLKRTASFVFPWKQ